MRTFHDFDRRTVWLCLAGVALGGLWVLLGASPLLMLLPGAFLGWALSNWWESR